MEAARNRRRLIVLTIMLAFAFVGLGCRLLDIQWGRHQEFRAKAEQQHEREFFREASRGDIRDRRGNLLATSVPAKTICADPALLAGHATEMARVLAPLLKTNEAALLPLLSRFWRTNRAGVLATNHYVVLKRRVPIEDWEKIQSTLGQHFTNLVMGKTLTPKARRDLSIVWNRSIISEPDQIRSYPNQQLAAHVLGFIRDRTNIVNNTVETFAGGVEGVEAAFDEKLRGTRGWVKTEFDSKRREIFVFRAQDVESRPGLNVMLSIDARIQQIAEEELQPMVTKHFLQSASAIVIRPKTGEILAMANLPTFDPNAPGRVADPGVRRNRIITDTFEPGSTFKTITVAGAFNDGIIRLTDMYDCENGIFYFAGKPLHDHEHYGVKSVREIIAHSSNIGTAKIAIKLGQERTHQYISNFGFGERSGLPLTGEVRGYVPRLKDWKQIHISRIPIGHGVSATPLQMAMAMAAVANGGVLMRPMIVDGLVDDKGIQVVKYQPQVVRRVVSEAAAKTTVDALTTVVERGTAAKAHLEHYTVAGKTGTAQKVVNGQYSHEKYYVSFIGFFPASNPELLIAISADEPLRRTGYYGGVVCAPVFKRIAERAANFLNIKPDVQTDKPSEVMAGERAPESALTQVRGKL
ncbi:MAG TPA: penicillin-binding protein 2 [Methylomirabilota bacterium]|nr:penicillin-binding protein 2 [Methylomirabilota bacterium]